MWKRGGSKFKNTLTRHNGQVFHSKKELLRFLHLEQLERQGIIENLRRQVRFPLIVNGVKIGVYVADHVYIDAATGKEVVEDTKSVFTRKDAVYRLKKALMQACHRIAISEHI